MIKRIRNLRNSRAVDNTYEAALMAGRALRRVGFIPSSAEDTALVEIAYAVDLNLARIQRRVSMTVSAYKLIGVWTGARMDLFRYLT